MFHFDSRLTVSADWRIATTWAVRQLKRAGFEVRRSFDLQVARAAHLDCSCPHHGSQRCDCQMVVFLVYAQQNPPATLVVHSRDGQTQFVLVDTPEQRPDPKFQAAIWRALDLREFVGQDDGTQTKVF